MIRYALRCCKGHAFDSWFRSAEAFEALRAGGHVVCPECGTTEIDKALMAPQVRPARRKAVAQDPPTAPERSLAAPASAREAALAELRRRIEEKSEYVGLEFASEARRIHAGEAPDRSIYGEARPDEARALIEEGVPVAPLPFLPARKAN